MTNYYSTVCIYDICLPIYLLMDIWVGLLFKLDYVLSNNIHESKSWMVNFALNTYEIL